MSTKQEYKKKMKQLAIMQAAESIFLNKAYSSITVDEIANQAGVTKKTLYSYFPSKLALFVRMFENYLQELHRLILTVSEEEISSDQKLRRIIEVQFTFTLENQDFMRLFWNLDSEEFDGVLPEELARGIRLWNRDMIDICVRVISRGQKDGKIRSCDPEMLVHLMSAFTKGVIFHTKKEAKLSIANVDANQLQELFTDFIFQVIFIGQEQLNQTGTRKTKSSSHDQNQSEGTDE